MTLLRFFLTSCHSAEIAAKTPRKPPQDATLAGIGLRSNIDVMLAATGVAIALSSVAFAGYMVADADRPPRIAGMEYLSVFAKPNHSLPPNERVPTPPSVVAAIDLAARSIDPTPTGSIPDKGGAARTINVTLAPDRVIAPTHVVDMKIPPSPYKLLDVANGEALIQSDTGFRHVRAGDTLPDFGRINTIEKRGDHWVMLTQNGAPLEWPAPAPVLVETPAPRKKTGPR